MSIEEVIGKITDEQVRGLLEWFEDSMKENLWCYACGRSSGLGHEDGCRIENTLHVMRIRLEIKEEV